MKNIRERIKKYRVIFILAIVLLASSFIYFYVSADADIYDNQITATVNQDSITIIDGTGDFDGDNEAGNDENNANKIVRNFDSIKYEFEYRLGYKSDTTLTEEEQATPTDRTVVVDILVPSTLNADVATTDEMNALTPTNVTIGGVEYKYYTSEHGQISVSDTKHNMQVIIYNINGKQGDIISPIIRIRESTDTSVAAISSETNIENINKISVDNVTVSAAERYGIQLYAGNPTKDNLGQTTKLMTGLVVYLPEDGTKGIKGVQVPTDITFNVNALTNLDSSYATIKSGSRIVDYSTEFQTNEAVIDRLPSAYSPNNGDSSILSQTDAGNNTTTFNIKIEGLSFHDQKATLSNDQQVYYLSSKVFVFENDKAEKVEDEKVDVSYTISTDKTPSNAINLVDNYKPFVGDYISNINFKSTKDSLVYEDQGKAIFNYNEDFYIDNLVKYGIRKGDKLENGLVHYIKIDNTAFALQKYENTSDDNLDYSLKFSIGQNSDPNTEVKYGLGEWNSSYFEMKANHPSYCRDVSSLSKEELMNYYGGPCIQENENVQWVNSIEEAIQANKADKIIIFKLSVLDQFDKGSQILIGLKAKAVKNTANIGNTFEIVSRGETTYENNVYYMSELEKVSVANQPDDLYYTKTTYTNSVPSDDKTTIGQTQLPDNVGNTVLISPFKVNITNIELRDAFSSNKNTFYSGMTDPIEFEISPYIRKSDYDATFTGATISVYLPVELEIFQDVDDKAYNTQTSGGEVTLNVDENGTIVQRRYRVYNYDYSQEDIMFSADSSSGTIPNLKLHAYIDISIDDSTTKYYPVYANISAKLKPSMSSAEEYTDVAPIEKRQYVTNMTLRNTSEINSNGRAMPSRIEENGSYVYNMRSANTSVTSSNLALLYILPYSGDNIGDGSEFSGSLSVKLQSALPSGYRAVYTTDDAKILLMDEINGTSSVNWKDWSNVTTALSNITAIKIIATNPIPKSGYFVSKDGINLEVTTNGNKEAEKYYNNFYMIEYDADICVYDDILSTTCTNQKGNQSFTSNVTRVSVLDRLISGYVFEDSDYNGLNQDEPALSDISVELYKLGATEFDPKMPVNYISETDELVKDSVTNNDGYYKFEGLSSGNYYVKYIFDCSKYTITEKNKTEDGVNTITMDSDANMVNGDDETKCYAVSNIQTLNNEKLEANNIDLGLRVRQKFDIKLRKYITNVTVNSATESNSYDYDRQSKVKIDIRNLKSAVLRVSYLIEIENTKYFPGIIGNIIENVPEGMTFDPSLQENDGWYEDNGSLYYANLSKTLIMPGEKYYITIVFDLYTETGGDYVNIVAANNLQIEPVTTSFVDPEEGEVDEPEDEYIDNGDEEYDDYYEEDYEEYDDYEEYEEYDDYYEEGDE